MKINETLKKVNGRWALVSKSNPKKVLQYYDGPKDKKPSEEWVKKVERRIHAVEESVLTEGTDQLYHATSIKAALDILQSGEFKLASTVGNSSEENVRYKNYPYFLSLSRSKVGDYHKNYSQGVVFDLDGRWLNERYPIKPVDYWERMWLSKDTKLPIGDKSRETEDRLYSKKPTIPSTAIRSVHILWTGNFKDQNYLVRRLMIAAKKKGIPVYFYTNQKDWVLQNTKNARKFDDMVKAYTKGPEQKSYQRPRSSKWLKAWIELYYKNDYDHLSDQAKKYYRELFGYFDQSKGLEADLHSAAKPNALGYPEVIKLNKIMQKHNLKTAKDFIDFLKEKWTRIRDEKRKQEMSNESIITESNGDMVILVDFQPEYETANGYDEAIDNAVEYLNQKRPSKIWCFYNGNNVGVEDTKRDVAWHYLEHGLDEDLIHNIQFREKTYAFLRNWMDTGVEPSAIIKAIRYMVMNRINDSRDVDPEQWQEILGDQWDDRMEDDMIYIPDISIAELKALSGALMGGGGRHECLSELQLLMNAFNIKYKLVDEWIY